MFFHSSHSFVPNEKKKRQKKKEDRKSGASEILFLSIKSFRPQDRGSRNKMTSQACAHGSHISSPIHPQNQTTPYLSSTSKAAVLRGRFHHKKGVAYDISQSFTALLRSPVPLPRFLSCQSHVTVNARTGEFDSEHVECSDATAAY